MNSIVIKRKVLFGDCDPEGIVYTPRFSYFALEATHEVMEVLLGAPSINALKGLGVLTPVRAFDLEFLSPATWDDELNLTVSVSNISEHSFTFRISGSIESGRSVFVSKLTYVTVSNNSKEKVKVPETLKSALGEIQPKLDD